MPDYGITLKREGRLAIVTMNRPSMQNSFDQHMWDSMRQAINELDADLPRAVVVTGAGDKAFSAGFDVSPENPMIPCLADALQKQEKAPLVDLIRMVRTGTDSLVQLPVPVIAAINGLAYGGGAEIACRCDMRVMDPAAIICFSEVKLGLMPDHGGVVGLTRLIGPSRAADLILSARKVTAQEAFQLGLVNRISAPGRSLEEAIEMAEAIADNGPLAVRHALSVIRRTQDMTCQQAMELESAEAVALIASGECMHGITAFLARQKPVFPDPD